MLAPGPWMMSAQAGTLAQLQLQASSSKVRAALQQPQQQRMELCVGFARGANCRATLETALRSTTPASASRGQLYQAVAASHTTPVTEDSGLRDHQIAVKFNEDPEWKRRAKVMARDGLPFMRIPEGANRELLVGITPHGTLGFSLKDTTGQ
jgi:hypothetical protein